MCLCLTMYPAQTVKLTVLQFHERLCIRLFLAFKNSCKPPSQLERALTHKAHQTAIFHFKQDASG